MAPASDVHSRYSSYYIGCTNWTWEDFRNNKMHRYVHVPTYADIDILRNLIDGRSHRLQQLDDTPVDHCTTVLSKKPHVAKCSYIHQKDGDVVEGRMVETVIRKNAFVI